MVKQEMVYESRNGVRLKDTISKNHLNLITRAVPEEEIRVLYDTGISFEAMSRKLGIAVSALKVLADYYDFPERVKPQPIKAPVDIDKLAERIYDYIEPKLDAKIKALVEQAVLNALK